MKIDHICFAVTNLDEGIAYWQHVFGYRQMTKIVENSLEKVKVTFLSKEDSLTIKLIEPLESNQSLTEFCYKGWWFSSSLF